MGYRSYSYDEYLKAIDMHRRGLGSTEISRKLGIPEPTINGWIYRGKKPPLAKWHPEPSKELAYVLGVLNGDGDLHRDKRDYKIRLRVKDYEFAEFFSKNIARLLNRKTLKPKWNKSDNKWRITYCSKAFYIWYKEQNLKTLKQYIEYDKECVVGFLRGLYDSEGNHHKSKKGYSRIHLSNSNTVLLKYTQHLLGKYFSIVARGPHLHVKAGKESKMKNGKIVKTKHDNYRIDINRRQYVQRFLNEIGFSIPEKQLGLKRRKK